MKSGFSSRGALSPFFFVELEVALPRDPITSAGRKETSALSASQNGDHGRSRHRQDSNVALGTWGHLAGARHQNIALAATRVVCRRNGKE